MNRTLRTLAIATALLAGAAFAQPNPVGSWQGAIELPGAQLEIRARFTLDDAALAATLDIPAQGLIDFALAPVALEGDALRFGMPGVPGDPMFEGTIAGDRIEGTFTQGGQAFAFALERTEAIDVRPQEPLPPFPYLAEEVTLKSGDVTLAGTLTLPEGEDRVPAVLLITGSGPQDRDEEIVGHKPFLLIADRLTRAGFAVLRVDDRGVGGSSGSDTDATFADLAADVGAGLDLLAAHPRVDAAAMGLLGHSQGGYLAPYVAAERDDVAFAILMAGPAVDGFTVLEVQSELMIARTLAGQGASQDAIDAAVAGQLDFLRALNALLQAEDFDGVRALVRERVEAEIPADQRPPSDEFEAFIAMQQEGIVSSSFRAFLAFDPRPYLEQLEVPTLALFGSLDFQVDAVQSEGPMREALAGNPDATVVTFEGLNHLMQPATTGLLEEYGSIEVTMDEVVLQTIVDWASARFVNR
ncbi:MAG: alpha/beta fold hydrolase [Trueperaceae bacterium]